tara:strand:+ start:875 stop:1594 length:720 start_codon:yes stop_codon:yes gene_type:complete
MMTQKTKTSIQERMQNKAFEALGEVEHQIDQLLDKKKSSFSMYKYLKRIDYSGRVVNYMKGFAENTLYELHNEEKCDQLDEAYSFLTAKQKAKVIKTLETWESEVEQYCEEYKPVRRIRPKTPKQLVKKLPYLDVYAHEDLNFQSINPEEIIRARILYTYNVSSKKLTKFDGHLQVKGSRITGFDSCREKTLTDLTLLDRLYKGGNIIASRFLDEIPRSKEKDGNDLITKNTLLVKVVK